MVQNLKITLHGNVKNLNHAETFEVCVTVDFSCGQFFTLKSHNFFCLDLVLNGMVII